MKLSSLSPWNAVSNQDAIAPSLQTKAILSRAFSNNVTVVCYSCGTTKDHVCSIRIFPAFQKSCGLYIQSVLLEPSLLLVFIRQAVSTIPQLCLWDVVLYKRCMCTLSFSSSFASKSSRHPKDFRSSSKWSGRWIISGYSLAYNLIQWGLQKPFDLLYMSFHSPLRASDVI